MRKPYKHCTEFVILAPQFSLGEGFLGIVAIGPSAGRPLSARPAPSAAAAGWPGGGGNGRAGPAVPAVQTPRFPDLFLPRAAVTLLRHSI